MTVSKSPTDAARAWVRSVRSRAWQATISAAASVNDFLLRHRQLAIAVISAVTLMVVGTLLFLWLVSGTWRNLKANLPSELVGVAVSAVLTVLLIEVVLQERERNRLKPATERLSTVLESLALGALDPFLWRMDDDAPDVYADQQGAIDWLRERNARERYEKWPEQVRGELATDVSGWVDSYQKELAFWSPVLVNFPNWFPLMQDLSYELNRWKSMRSRLSKQAWSTRDPGARDRYSLMEADRMSRVVDKLLELRDSIHAWRRS